MSVRTASIRTVATVAAAGLLATMFTASTAFAATKTEANAEAPAPAATKAQPDGDKRLYCVRDKPTGTRITREKCMTRTQWADRGFDVDNPDA